MDYVFRRNFEGVIEKAKLSCFNSGHRIEDHFVDVNEMIEIGKGGQRPVKTVLLSRYACYLVIQNADPKKEIVAHGQTYFAIQTRRQELADEHIEEDRRLLLREVMNTVGSTIHVNFNTSKTSRLTFAEFTEVYQIEADFKDRV
jgi:DNA-damage-inducible protein D